MHRRCINRVGDRYEVVDYVLWLMDWNVALRWRLCPGDWRREGNLFRLQRGEREFKVSIAAPESMRVELISGQVEPRIEGWESLYYADRQPVPTIVVAGEVELPLKLKTTIEIL